MVRLRYFRESRGFPYRNEQEQDHSIINYFKSNDSTIMLGCMSVGGGGGGGGGGVVVVGTSRNLTQVDMKPIGKPKRLQTSF